MGLRVCDDFTKAHEIVNAFFLPGPVRQHGRPLKTSLQTQFLSESISMNPIQFVTEGLSLSLSLSAQMPDDKIHLLLPLLLQQAFLHAMLLA